MRQWAILLWKDYYDNVREHSSLSYQTPFAYLKSQLPDLDDKIRFVIPIMLDKVSVELGPWSGYHVLAQHPPYPWIWMVLVGIAGLLLTTVFALLIPTKIWHDIANFFPIRIVCTLVAQVIRPSRFPYIQNPKFEFLPMSGGINERKWNAEFSIISCLFHDLKVDKIDIIITYPIKETYSIGGDVLIKHLNFTKIESGQANMSDTSFHYLERQAKLRDTKKPLPVRCKFIGLHRGKKRFTIEEQDCYQGELNEWGQNNPTKLEETD